MESSSQSQVSSSTALYLVVLDDVIVIMTVFLETVLSLSLEPTN